MHTPKIIAEIGQNHNGDMSLAKEMISMCAEAGADYAKFQLYNAKKLFSKENNPWYDYNIKTEITFDQFLELDEFCKKCGINFMASVFDTERLNWLIEAKSEYVKIASRSIYDTKLLDAVISSNLKVIVSLGLWEEKDFPEIFNKISSRTSFLYCVSKYPTSFDDLNLAEINFSENHYSGFSDHTIGISAAIIALCKGAKIIEKHFTLDKSMYGPDHSGSMSIHELRQLVEFRNDLEKILNE